MASQCSGGAVRSRCAHGRAAAAPGRAVSGLAHAAAAGGAEGDGAGGRGSRHRHGGAAPFGAAGGDGERPGLSALPRLLHGSGGAVFFPVAGVDP